MADKLVLTNTQVSVLCEQLLKKLPSGEFGMTRLYGVPRGGIPVVYRLTGIGFRCTVVDDPAHADAIIDDIIDSGVTRLRFEKKYPEKPFFALIDKTSTSDYDGQWVVFPWEKTDEHDQSATDVVTRLLQVIGEDPNRGGLRETPARVLKAWKEMTCGYGQDPHDILKVFEDGAANYDEMIVRRHIPLYSFCEHHMLPMFGSCTIAYIPDGKIVGLSKMDRLVNVFARRLQVQERLTCQIADAMFDILKPKGVGVWISARHMCVEARGIKHQHSETVTTALRGCIKDVDAARAEFLALARGK